MANCIRCRREIPEGSLFCNFCGKKQGGEAAPQKRKRRRPRGTGSVYKIGGTRARPWVAVDSTKTVLGCYATSGEAVLALDEHNASTVPRERRNYTLRDVYEAWRPNHFSRIGPSGQYSYTSAFQRAEPLHDRRMADLKTEDYQSVIDSATAAGLSRSLCEKQRQLFSQLCQYAMQQDIINKNYASFLVLPTPTAPKDRVLTTEEIGMIREKLNDRRLGETAKIAITLIYTGLRINELLLARVENVHLEERYMVGGEKTEAGRNRIIPLHREILPFIQGWVSGRTEGWLIATASGNHKTSDNVRKSFSSLMAACGIKGVTPHTCRHTAATYMVKAGIPPEALKQILGHRDFSTTVNIYTHTRAADLVAQLDTLKIC